MALSFGRVGDSGEARVARAQRGVGADTAASSRRVLGHPEASVSSGRHPEGSRLPSTSRQWRDLGAAPPTGRRHLLRHHPGGVRVLLYQRHQVSPGRPSPGVWSGPEFPLSSDSLQPFHSMIDIS